VFICGCCLYVNVGMMISMSLYVVVRMISVCLCVDVAISNCLYVNVRITLINTQNVTETILATLY
jgi:hypothetical protein